MPIQEPTGSTGSDSNTAFTHAARILSESRIRRIEWSGIYSDNDVPTSDDFVINIHQDDNGVPGTTPLATFAVGNNVSRTLVEPISTLYNYSAEIDFLFKRNVVYWISVIETGTSAGNFLWGVADSPGLANCSFSGDSGATWAACPSDLTFDMRLYETAVFDNGMSLFTSTSNFDADSETLIGAVSFSPNESLRVSSVQWSGAYFSLVPAPASDNFRIEVYADDNGTPVGGTPLASFNVGSFVNRTQSPSPSGNFYEYSAGFSVDFTMQAGETYWWTVYDQGPSSDPNFVISNRFPETASFAFSTNGGASWTVTDDRRIDLTLSGFPPASNDSFAGTFNVGSPDFNLTEFNVGASTEIGEQQLENTGSTVWRFYTAPADGMLTVDTFGSNFDTQLHIFDGFFGGATVADLNPVVNNNNAIDPDTGILLQQSRVSFEVTEGSCYEIRVGGWRPADVTGPGDEGCIVLNGVFEEGEILLGDVNCDGMVNLLDVGPFIDAIGVTPIDPKADINEDGVVNLLDVLPFINLLSGG